MTDRRADGSDGLRTSLGLVRRHPGEVRIVFFGREGTPASGPALRVVEEIAREGAPGIELERFEADDQPAFARSFQIRHVPCAAIVGPDGDTGIRFYGTPDPRGIIAAVRVAAGVDPGLGAASRALLGELVAPERLRLFVLGQDPRTPLFVQAVAAVTVASRQLRAEIIPAVELARVTRLFRVTRFPELLLGTTPIDIRADADAIARSILASRLIPFEQAAGTRRG